MRQIAFLLVAVAIVAGIVAYMPSASGQTVVIENPKLRSVGWRGGYCRRKRALENSANRLWRS
jgi:hypothetical protein